MSQDVEMNLVNARDEFKWGVKFYNQGLYEKSVFSFERSLSYDPSDLQTHLWLGHAYYMKGDVEAALKEWSILEDDGHSPLWLDSLVEIISAGRGVKNVLYKPKEWVPLYNKEFSRPSTVLTFDTGESAVISFKDNKVTFLDANGAITNTIKGGLDLFNGPFDIIEGNNRDFIVTEILGDQISFVNNIGLKTKSINPKEDPLAGPQYLTKDDKGFFYVSDWGNRRVCKFNMDGELILSIRDKRLKGPSGVLVVGDYIYVADQLNMTLLLFDQSGNFINTVIDRGLEGPEGLTKIDDNSIMIADGTTLKKYDIELEKLTVISDLQGKASRITKGAIDANGNTLITDFNLGQFYSLTDVSSLYGGLYVKIDRINSAYFPEIEVELQVYNRLGEPLVGLDNTNFLVSESGRVVPKRDVVFKGYKDSSLDLGLIFDLNSTMSDYLESYFDITDSILKELESKDDLTIIKAGELPGILSNNRSEALDGVSSLTEGDFTDRDGVDLSIKLAATSLIPSKKRREVLLVSDGKTNKNDFIRYSLEEIKDFLINNRISLSVLYVNQNKNEELEYLIDQSGGYSRYLYSGRGSKGLLDKGRERKSCFYVIKYNSLQKIDNGEIYTPVEIELNYIRKSGRSELGYFVPIKVVQ